MNLLQGKPSAQMSAVSAGKTLPQGATIVKLVATQAGECGAVRRRDELGMLVSGPHASVAVEARGGFGDLFSHDVLDVRSLCVNNLAWVCCEFVAVKYIMSTALADQRTCFSRLNPSYRDELMAELTDCVPARRPVPSCRTAEF